MGPVTSAVPDVVDEEVRPSRHAVVAPGLLSRVCAIEVVVRAGPKAPAAGLGHATPGLRPPDTLTGPVVVPRTGHVTPRAALIRPLVRLGRVVVTPSVVPVLAARPVPPVLVSLVAIRPTLAGLAGVRLGTGVRAAPRPFRLPVRDVLVGRPPVEVDVEVARPQASRGPVPTRPLGRPHLSEGVPHTGGGVDDARGAVPFRRGGRVPGTAVRRPIAIPVGIVGVVTPPLAPPRVGLLAETVAAPRPADTPTLVRRSGLGPHIGVRLPTLACRPFPVTAGLAIRPFRTGVGGVVVVTRLATPVFHAGRGGVALGHTRRAPPLATASPSVGPNRTMAQEVGTPDGLFLGRGLGRVAATGVRLSPATLVGSSPLRLVAPPGEEMAVCRPHVPRGLARPPAVPPGLPVDRRPGRPLPTPTLIGAIPVVPANVANTGEEETPAVHAFLGRPENAVVRLGGVRRVPDEAVPRRPFRREGRAPVPRPVGVVASGLRRPVVPRLATVLVGAVGPTTTTLGLFLGLVT